jgi:hypothetical protein
MFFQLKILTKIYNGSRNKFCKHNFKYFKKINSNKKILVEFNAFHSSHVAFSYLSNVLANKYNASIQPFFNYSILSAPLFPNWFDKLKWFLAKELVIINHKIYKSFGSDTCFKPIITKKNILLARLKTIEIFKKKKNKNDILKIVYKGILFGDLLYDTYLKSKYKPTIDIDSDEFFNFTVDFLSLCDFWIDYFNNNKVKAVIASHSVYSYAIIIRVAISQNIEAYGCTSSHVKKLSKSNFRMHANTDNYFNIFKKLDDKTKKNGLTKAKRILKKRVYGVTSVNAGFFGNVEISPFNRLTRKKEIIFEKKIKILILPHDFFDAVHLYGNFFFADFYEWLEFLGKFSKEKGNKYRWYIKLRPDYTGKFKKYHKMTEDIIDVFLSKNKHIIKISNNYSLHQIKKEKIDFVLTVHGTAAIEFPLINGPTVINASAKNPYKNCQFTITPKNLINYKSILSNLDKIKKIKINKDELYKFYFMRHLYIDKNWLIKQDKIIQDLKIWDGQYSDNFYLFWLKNFTEENHMKLQSRLLKFIQSNETDINIKV